MRERVHSCECFIGRSFLAISLIILGIRVGVGPFYLVEMVGLTPNFDYRWDLNPPFLYRKIDGDRKWFGRGVLVF